MHLRVLWCSLIRFSDPSIAKAAQLLKKDAVILRELRTFFRVVLQLDDGTIEDIEQRDIRSPKNRLDFGITEWQKIRHGDNGQKNVYHLIRALENAAKEEKCFTRITGKAVIPSSFYLLN